MASFEQKQLHELNRTQTTETTVQEVKRPDAFLPSSSSSGSGSSGLSGSSAAAYSRTNSQQNIRSGKEDLTPRQEELLDDEMFQTLRKQESKNPPKISHSVEDLGSAKKSINLLSNNNNTLPSKKSLQEFNQFFIFDHETEMYIPLSDAFFKGMIKTFYALDLVILISKFLTFYIWFVTPFIG